MCLAGATSGRSAIARSAWVTKENRTVSSLGNGHAAGH
jgi:hypothetical protein